MTIGSKTPIRRILIRANNWIGDVVMISPAVRAIRRHYPGSRIAILGKSWVLEALRGNPYYDDLIEYDNLGAHAGTIGRLRLVRQLRAARFDLAVLFQKAFEAAALAALARIPVRVGYATDLRRALLTLPVPKADPGAHHVDVFLGIARALGCGIEDRRPFFHLSGDDRERGRSLLAAAGVRDDMNLIALHPGASKAPRGWHPERFAALGRRLAERLSARIVLIGGPDDEVLLSRIETDLPRGMRVATGRGLPIRHLASVLERCRICIGNDSGPMHLAAALDVPTVGIFGPGAPSRTAPIGGPGRVATLWKEYPCSPCRQKFFRECPPSPAFRPFCLEEISVDEVETAALGLLESAPAAGPVRVV